MRTVTEPIHATGNDDGTDMECKLGMFAVPLATEFLQPSRRIGPVSECVVRSSSTRSATKGGSSKWYLHYNAVEKSVDWGPVPEFGDKFMWTWTIGCQNNWRDHRSAEIRTIAPFKTADTSDVFFMPVMPTTKPCRDFRGDIEDFENTKQSGLVTALQ
ncbi:hypothetical protein BC826DRAFT_1158310 [Russula brevipes]|nr:hypothetical protein BC826DRAFT_1158310 [Russula brevipes]